WSSYPIYLGKREPDEFFHSSYITNQVDSNSFIQEFQAFHHLDDEGYDFFDGETVYGDEEFIKRALEPAIVKSYSEFDHNEWVDSQLVELLYEAIYTRIDLSKRECLWLYVYALQDLTSLNYQEIVDLVDAPNKGALKQMNYRFKKGHLSTEKFASIYNGLRLIKDNVNTKRYGVTTRSE
ncbi:MAG: hypothetical protein OXU45_02860, partial [Candidatus Melainabacteria bacterium]|nr:hypothetical protein [Candidatus Melainabacteria bacterium]